MRRLASTLLLTSSLCTPAAAQFLTNASGVSPLRIAANLTRANYGLLASPTSSSNVASLQRAPYFLGRVPYTECWLNFSNWYLGIGNGIEINTGNAVQVAIALEANGVTVQAPNATVASPAMVADGADLLAGPFYPAQFGLSTFAANSEIFGRVGTLVSVGQQYPVAGQYLSVAPASRLWTTGDMSQIANTGTFTGQTNTNVGPAVTLVVCRAQVPYKEIAPLELGDSIGEGNSDTKQVLVGVGYFDRGAANVGGVNTPFAHMGRHGSAVSYLTLNNGQYFAKRLALMQYATHVELEYGANDLFYNTSSNVYTTYQNNMLSVIASAKAAGVQYIELSKIAPRTQSSDTFLSYPNQLQQYGYEATITASVSSNQLTVTVVSANNLFNNVQLSGAGLSSGCIITSQVSGTTRGVGVYNTSGCADVSSETIYANGGPGVTGYWDPVQITALNNWMDGLKTAGTINSVYSPLSAWTNPGDVTQWLVDGSTAWYCCTTGGDGNGALINNVQYIAGTHPSVPLNVSAGTLFGTQLGTWPTFN